VKEIAGPSGGEVVSTEQAAEELPRMLERIRGRYLLYYAAPECKAGTFRRIRVDLSQEARARYPHAVLRAREGYYASAAK